MTDTITLETLDFDDLEISQVRDATEMPEMGASSGSSSCKASSSCGSSSCCLEF